MTVGSVTVRERTRPRSAGTSRRLDATDLAIIDQAEDYLGKGLEIYRWFEAARRKSSFAHRFKLFDQLHRPDTNYGFLDDITVAGEPFPVLGTVQTTHYAQPRQPSTASAKAKRESVEWMREQVREYMLRYFMRVSSYRAPQFTPARPDREPPAFLRRLPYLVNLGAAGPMGKRGWGYRQLYYKRTDGEVGKFDKAAQRAIVDVRRIGPEYEWVILEVHVFDFTFPVPPFVADGQLQIGFPVKSVVKVVLSRDFVVDEADPEPGVVGRYGWGYAFIREESHPKILLGYGPDDLGPAFMNFYFDVLDTGEARLMNGFAANQPTEILNVSANPAEWGLAAADVMSLGMLGPMLAPLRSLAHRLPFGRASLRPVFNGIKLANILSGGLAARELSITRERLLELVLAIHFLDAYHFAVGTLETWNQIPDWTDTTNLPRWVVEGRSS